MRTKGSDRPKRLSAPMRIALAVIYGLWLIGLGLLLVREEPRAPEHAATGIVPMTSAPYSAYRAKDRDVASSVERLRAFVVRSETMNRDHTYSSTGLERLADAIEALAGRDDSFMVAGYCDSLRAAAARLRSDPYSLQHADDVREAFITASNLLKTLRHRQLPDRAGLAQPVVEAATAIEPDRLLLEQRAEVRQYFERSYELVSTMARRPI